MNNDELNQKIYNLILKKRSKTFHIITTFLTCGIWPWFYWLMKISYLWNTKYSQKYGNIQYQKDVKLIKKQGITITSYGVSGKNPYTNAVPHSVYANAYIERKQIKSVRDYVVFDTETTGLEPEIDKIIEISAIKYINNKKVAEFSQLVNPSMDFDPYITKLTGIKQQDLIGKPTINMVLPEFYNFIENYTLVAHNAPYDIKMLACEAYRNNIYLCNNKIIDTIPLAKQIISKDKVENYKLETLKKYLGLNFKSHRALDDCETCAKIYQLYLASKQKKKIVMIDEETGEILEEIN